MIFRKQQKKKKRKIYSDICKNRFYLGTAFHRIVKKKGCGHLDERQVPKAHKIIVNNRKASMMTGVIDVLAFDLNEVLLETEQGMLTVKGKDLHVNRLTLEKGEVDLSGHVDSICYADIKHNSKKKEGMIQKLFK